MGSGYSSSGKSFDQVKQDLHTLFRVRNEETGLDFSSDNSIDIYKIVENFGDITDRRALFAVSSDTTGTFTQSEKGVAYSITEQLREKAQGFLEPGGRDDISLRSQLKHARGFLGFLDQASPEEKATDEWKNRRANVQAFHERVLRDIKHSPDGSPADSPAASPVGSLDDVNTGDEDVNVLIKKLLKLLLEKKDWSLDELLALSRVVDLLVKEAKDTPDYAQAEKGFEQLPEPNPAVTSSSEQKSAQG